MVDKPQAVGESMVGLIHYDYADILASRSSQIDHNICWFHKTACLYLFGCHNWSPYCLCCIDTLSSYDCLLYHRCFFNGMLVRLVWLAQKLHSRWSNCDGFLLPFLDDGTIAAGFFLFCPTLVLDVCVMFISCLTCPWPTSFLKIWLT